MSDAPPQPTRVPSGRPDAVTAASYPRLYDVVPEVYYRTDLSGHVTEVSQSVSEVFGYTVEEVLHHVGLDHLWALAAEREQFRARLRERGRVVDFPFKARRKDGTTTDAITTACFFTNGEGAVVGVEGVARNISSMEQQRRLDSIRLQYLEFLSATALDFAAFPNDRDIYEYIAQKIREIAGDPVVVVSAAMARGSVLQCRAVAGFGAMLDTVLKVLGRHPAGMEFPVPEGVQDVLRGGRLVELPGGLAVAALGQIPAPVCAAIEKIVGARSVHSIGVVREGALLAGVTLISRSGTLGPERVLAVETFASQASVALQRRLAEDSLRESECRYRDLVENINEVIYVLDRDLTLTYVTPAVERLLGYAPSELLGTSVIRIFPPEVLPILESKTKTIFSGGTGSGEYPVLTKAGQTRWVQTSSQPIVENGRVTGIRGVLVDITERKRAELALQDSERSYRQLVESAHEGIWRIDAKAISTFVNPAMAEMLGYGIDEMLGRAVFEFMDEHDAGAYAPRIATGKACQLGLGELTRLRRKDGNLIDVRLNTRPISEKVEECTGLVMLVSDVSKQRALEDRVLEASTEELHRIGRDLHDGLGQELAGAAYMCKVLEQRIAAASPEDSPTAARIGELIDGAIGRTRSLVSLLNPVGPDADGLANALKTMAANVTKGYGIACDFECPAPVPVDDRVAAEHLFRIAQEAVNNAMKHGRARCIRIALRNEKRMASLSVADDGVGMPASIAPGMGLQTMRYRSQRIDATLTVEPGDGGGTVVTCVFPRSSRRRGKGR